VWGATVPANHAAEKRSGFLKPTSGTIVSNTKSLVGQAAFVIAQMGIKYVPQDKKVFSDLTVRENLELGSYASKDYDWTPVTNYFPKLKILMDRKAGYLSGGERQMLMIGRAILGDPKLLLIDEPTRRASSKYCNAAQGRISRIKQEDGAGYRGAESSTRLRHRQPRVRVQRWARHGGINRS
jgi:branched-chain amino acid transport system ATP-binding protein